MEVFSNKELEKNNNVDVVSEDNFSSLITTKKRSRRGKKTYVSQEERDKLNRKKLSKRKREKIEKLGGIKKESSANNDNDTINTTVLISKRAEERKLKPIEKLKNILSYGFVCLLAVVLGFVAGSMYVESAFSESYEFTESEWRYSEDELNRIISSNTSVNNTNSLYAFLIAEEKLKELDYVCETPEGSSYTSPDIAPTQTIYSYRKKSGLSYEYLTVTEGIMSVAEKVVTSDGGDNFDIWRTKTVTSGQPVFTAEPSFKMTNDEARAEYGTDMTNPFPYVISNKTIHESYKNDPFATGSGEKNNNGDYVFTLKLNTTQSVMNYVKQMKHMSELKNYPVFFDITIEFVLDREFRFVSTKIVENYKITYFGVPATCHAEMHQKFLYE